MREPRIILSFPGDCQGVYRDLENIFPPHETAEHLGFFHTFPSYVQRRLAAVTCACAAIFPQGEKSL